MRIVKLLSLFCFVVCMNHLTAQPFSIKEHYIKRIAYIPMRDGINLFTIIYLPKDSSQKYPVLLNRTPYGIAPYEPDTFPERLRPSDHFAREGYIFVFQDVRGRALSEGNFVNMTPQVP